MSEKLHKPCKSCPFSRKVTPGELGGSPASKFIGQVFGPFWLPCHCSPGYEGNRSNPKHSQCAGAAIFRANIGRAELLPPQLHKLPADAELVFASAAEFLAHHAGVTVEDAAGVLRLIPPAVLLKAELGAQGVQHVELERP